MSKPLISVIVPIYNVERYLPKCIDSILMQTFRDFELLLIDDGSSDRSGIICEEYADKDDRVRVFHKENGGVSRARNTGLEYSHGDKILFVDSDDWLEPFCLERIVSVDSDLVFFGFVHEFPNGCQENHSPKASISLGRNEIEKTILYLKDNAEHYEYFGYTCNKLFSTSIIRTNKLKFIEGLSMREDEIFTAQYCQYINRLSVINDILYHYRIITEGLTARLKRAAEYIDYANYLQKTIGWYSLPALCAYESSRVILYLAMAFRQSHSFHTRWRLAKHIKNVRSKYLKYTGIWGVKTSLLAHGNSLFTFFMLYGYSILSFCKKRILKSRGL